MANTDNEDWADYYKQLVGSPGYQAINPDLVTFERKPRHPWRRFFLKDRFSLLEVLILQVFVSGALELLPW
jgi:hypothetical protein